MTGAETCLKYDATLYKVVERNAATPTAIKLGNEEPVQLVGQAIPKVGQRCTNVGR